MNRRGAILLLCLVVLPLLYGFYIASSLIALILEDGLEDSVSLADIEAHGNVSDALHPIPKILHQTWKNEHVPEHWQIAQFTWYAIPPNPVQRLT
jgi:inositol phosphorylceramide mannosyltransferase catalytic subunit